MKQQLYKHEFIIFAMDHYNPLGLARSLGEEGIESIVIAEKSKTDITSYCKYVKEYIRVETADDGYKVLMERFAGKYENKPFLLTCDDRTIEFLDRRYDEWKDFFIGFNGGENGRISRYMDKFEILGLAKKHGLNVLETFCVDKGVVPEALEYPIITKSISPVVGGWKSDVHICHNEEELLVAYDKIKAPQVIIQKYIDKKNEYCIDGFCAAKGTVMFNAIESRYNYLIPGYYSPYMTVENFEQKEIGESLAAMMQEVQFEGIYSIEFLIDQDDTYYFSEINFRNSTWSYAATKAGMNLPMLWAKAMLSKKLEKDPTKTIEDGFMAMVEPIDYAKRVPSGRVEWGEWLRDFRQAKCPFYYSEDDIEPFLYMCRNWEKFG